MNWIDRTTTQKFSTKNQIRKEELTWKRALKEKKGKKWKWRPWRRNFIPKIGKRSQHGKCWLNYEEKLSYEWRFKRRFWWRDGSCCSSSKWIKANPNLKINNKREDAEELLEKKKMERGCWRGGLVVGLEIILIKHGRMRLNTLSWRD